MGITYPRTEFENLDISKGKKLNKPSINSVVVRTARIRHNIQTSGGKF